MCSVATLGMCASLWVYGKVRKEMQERPEGLQPPGCCLVSPWVLGCCSPCRAGSDLTFSPGCEASRGLVMLKLVMKNQGHKLLGGRGDWSSGLCVSTLLSL